MKINNFTGTPHFGHKIIIDIGASNPKGTMKTRVESDNGKLLYKDEGYLNNTSEGFKIYKSTISGKSDGGQTDFIDKLHAAIKHANGKILEMADRGEVVLSNKDKQLNGVAVFVPGTTFTHMKDDKIAFIPNLKNTNGESLVDIDFKKYEKELKEGKNRGKKMDIGSEFELVVTKDLGGAGLGIAKKMAEEGKLQTGDYIMGVMTGGGFGSVDIKVKEDYGNKQYVEFETSESSSYLSGNITVYDKLAETVKEILKAENPKKELSKLTENNNEKMKELMPVLGKLGRQGVSVKSHLRCFFEALQLDMPKDEFGKFMNVILKVGDARIVSDDIMYVPETDEKLVNQVIETGYFDEIESDKKGKRKFTTNKDKLPEDKTKAARIHTVNDYANAVSLISINKINDCINKVVLVGPFAQGLNRHIKENPDDYGVNDLPELIMKKITTNIDKDHVDLPSTKRLMDLYNFEIICDPKINISDNTDAGNALLDPALRFTPNRGSWFSIPTYRLLGKDRV